MISVRLPAQSAHFSTGLFRPAGAANSETPMQVALRRLMSRMARFPLRPIPVALSFAACAALAAALLAPASLAAPSAPFPTLPRVSGPIDDSQRVVLQGNVHPLARAEFDRGAVEDSFPADRLLLLLKRSDAQESALRDFIQDLHTPGNPAFHQWLKPDQFGRLYGPADSDLAAVTAWLQSHGFTVNQVHPGRMGVEFSGTARQVREAFHTEIHRYEIGGETHYANNRDPEIPAALAPVVTGLAPMNNFRAKPDIKVLGRAEFNPKTHEAKPDWTYPDGGGSWNLVVAPGDFAVQYDINPVYKSGITGAGQSIAIISASNVDLGLVAHYQTLFGLTSSSLPEVVVDGSDPGLNGAATEAYLDIELSGSVAPGASVILYTSDGTALTDGLALAAYRAVGDDLAGTISTSYGECEAELGQGGNAFWLSTWEQAATQGQSAFVSAGDGGSAGCDDFDTQAVAYSGLAVNGIGSTPYNVSVGGTDFYYSDVDTSSSAMYSQIASYWSGTKTTPPGTTSPAVSLLKPAPEQVWNDMFGYNTADLTYPPVPDAGQIGENIVAGSGGKSSAALYPSGASNPGVGYPKPAWQAGPGVPADKVRDLPDLSLYASNDANWSFYPICANAGDCVNVNSSANGGAPWITGVGGTSASSPAMAAIQALVNQSTKSWQGQADFFYYPIAKLWPDAFHDITVGGNEVPCSQGSPNCALSSTGITKGYYVDSGYPAGTGYDLASGLGSVDVKNLIFWWPHVSMTPTTTTLGVSPASFVHGKTTTITSTVARTGGSGTPTGSISLGSNDGISHYAGIDYLYLNSNAKVDTPVDNLPGGTYQLTARYGGDGTFAASTSAPVTITVTPETDTLATSGWAWNPYDLYIYPLSPGITLPYGAQIFLDAQPLSTNATEANFGQPATGNVTFTDKVASATTTSTQPIDTFGTAEWETGVFAVGSHTVAESYSGDASYKSSAAPAAASFKVIPGSTYMEGGPLTTSVRPGGSVTVNVELFTGYLPLLGALPTGNVTVTLGGVSKSVPWTSFGKTGDAYAEVLVGFTGVPAGILPVTASYPGDANWLGSSANFGTVIALSTKLAPTVTLTSSVTNPAPGQVFTLTASVAGPSGKPIPTGSVTFFTDDESTYFTEPLVNGKVSVELDGAFGANGTNILAAYYRGDANYTTGTSNAVDIAVSKAGFSLTTLTPEVSIAAGKSGTSTAVLAPFNKFNAAIHLTATAPAGITATPAPLPSTVSGLTNDTINITVASGKAAGTYPVVVTAYTAGKGIVHTALILVSVP